MRITDSKEPMIFIFIEGPYCVSVKSSGVGIDPMVAAKIGRWVNPKVPSKHYYAVDDLTRENVMKEHLFASN